MGKKLKCAKCGDSFPSGKKLFAHLRLKHELRGFQRRGRVSEFKRQATRQQAPAADEVNAAHANGIVNEGQGRPTGVVGLPSRARTRHMVWVRVPAKATASSGMAAHSPETAAPSPAMASSASAGAAPTPAVASPVTASTAVSPDAASPAMAATSPAMAATSPVMAATHDQHSPETAAHSPAKAATSPETASDTPEMASELASAHVNPCRDCGKPCKQPQHSYCSKCFRQWHRNQGSRR